MTLQVLPVRVAALVFLAVGPPALAMPPASKPCSSQECLAAEVAALRVVEASRHEGARLLDTVGQAVPELLWLENLTYRRGEISVEGIAYNTNAIADFIEALDRAEQFSEPRLIDTEEVETDVYRFKISAERARTAAAGEASAGGKDEQALRAERTELLRGIRKRTEVPATLKRLRKTIEESEMRIEAFRPHDLSSLTTIDALPVRIQLSDATYHDLAILFDRLRRLPTFVFLTDLVIRSDPDGPGTITAAFTLEIPTLD